MDDGENNLNSLLRPPKSVRSSRMLYTCSTLNHRSGTTWFEGSWHSCPVFLWLLMALQLSQHWISSGLIYDGAWVTDSLVSLACTSLRCFMWGCVMPLLCGSVSCDLGLDLLVSSACTSFENHEQAKRYWLVGQPLLVIRPFMRLNRLSYGKSPFLSACVILLHNKDLWGVGYTSGVHQDLEGDQWIAGGSIDLWRPSW